MDQQLELLKAVCAFFAEVFGTQTEIVIHDMRSGEIAFIVNGEITGREAGLTDQASTIRLLAVRADQEETPGRLVGYRTMSFRGKALRSSNLFLKDEQGEYRYSICINQDVSGLDMLQSYIDSFMGDKRLARPAIKGEETVDNLILNIILSEMEQAKPMSLDSRETKLGIIKRLDEKGVFDVRHAGPKVCELLQIAQPTLYKYLKEIRQEEREEENA